MGGARVTNAAGLEMGGTTAVVSHLGHRSPQVRVQLLQELSHVPSIRH